LKNKEREIDLIIASESFSYIENWRQLLKILANNTKYFLISLYIPPDPIGFVKSKEELVSEIENCFEIVELVSLRERKFIIIFGRSKVHS